MRMKYLTLNITFQCLLLGIISDGSILHTTALQNDSEDLNLGKLIFASLIYRHGDRTPVKSYPTDPYQNISYWPEGLGQLTNVGKEEQYELGIWLRRRYDKFLPEMYSLQDIHIHSTDVDRTLMSAELNLAGLYPPSGSQVWHSDLKWQPIPIHTKPELEDEVLAAKKPCKRYELELQKVMQSEIMHRINKKYAELFQYLSKNCGCEVKDVISLEFLYDTLHCEELHNLTLPDWTKGVYPDKMRPLAAFSFRIQAMNKQLQRLKSGPLLGEIISNMKKVVAGSLLPPWKLVVYSAHDTTVANFLMTLGVFDDHCPPYAALILIELRMKLEDYYITISYRNSTTHDPYILKIPGCDAICPLEKFIALTEPVIPINWAEECQVRSMMEEFQLNSLAVLALSISVFLAFLLFISIILSVLYWKRQRSSSYYYHKVHTEVQ